MRSLSTVRIALLISSIVIALGIAIAAIIFANYSDSRLPVPTKTTGSTAALPSSSNNTNNSTETDIITDPNEDNSQETGDSSLNSAAFDKIVSLGSGSLPLRSQRAITTWNDQALVVLTDGNDIVVAESTGSRHRVTTLQRSTGGPTIAASNDLVVVAWVTPAAIMSSSSTDLVTWTTPVVVGERKEEGGPIPSIDWTGSDFAVVWVDAPKTNVQTGAMDGVGSLMVAVGDGTSDWSAKALNSTTAMVTISNSTIVWRDDRSATGSGGLDTVRTANLDGSAETVICSGYDPAISVDGSSIAIGYHLGVAAHLRTTLDGKTWEDIILDSTGKFVSPFTVNGKFGAVWVDYTDAAAANDARNNSGHRTTASWNGVEYKMNNGATKTIQGQGEIVAEVPVAVYSVDGVIYLAY